MGAPSLGRYCDQLRACQPLTVLGRVSQVVGLVAEVRGLELPVGASVFLHLDEGPVLGEVVGFKGQGVQIMPYADTRGLRPGCLVSSAGGAGLVKVGQALLGRVLDGLGNPVDGGPMPEWDQLYPLYRQAPSAMGRPRISQPVDVGVKVINALLTLGKGQRIGIFAGSGVGKSTLMSMIARHTQADISVIGLVGERGRELREFIERDLGPEGLARSVVIVATSDQPALVRMRAAYLATAVAEYFRDQSRDVILMMDSVTRFAMAGREVGLSIGEPPTTKGYTPSVFAQLPRLLERAGTSEGGGSITGIYTVLVEGDDVTEPVADAMRSILDGHFVLTRALADRGHYPAIELLGSISRLARDINPPEVTTAARRLTELLAAYRRNEDLINIGAYADGSNPVIDRAIRMMERINKFLTQPVEKGVDITASRRELVQLMAQK
ncbi:flagellar protein export ATPase FliI [Desulfarculus baarsii DSM 2075]|uniref:Flagellar protein export ATPase FliI n=1 Tax=Desulfarculus baarsii (strain ATCC 33931 / DSM 2075 / LMG 7858 / VKM B-1802 / 2st14) TaxID=644282 RepID=E1QFE9_DESB2|nr:FliI/YscN family ATPase [Desulfarculus baarsii]ADK84285.1 flagellar protein export ATPase FliI [Desulfarculus baarsii DSM 2075]